MNFWIFVEDESSQVIENYCNKGFESQNALSGKKFVSLVKLLIIVVSFAVGSKRCFIQTHSPGRSPVRYPYPLYSQSNVLVKQTFSRFFQLFTWTSYGKSVDPSETSALRLVKLHSLKVIC